MAEWILVALLSVQTILLTGWLVYWVKSTKNRGW